MQVDQTWTNSFYEEYAEHLKEPIVRKTHDEMFRIFNKLQGTPLNILDLGCGTSEYNNYNHIHKRYFGVDKNRASDKSPTLVADFNDLDFEMPWEPIAFISTFATEIIQPPQQRYDYYKKLFAKYPTLNTGMVAGFFYKGKENEPLVEENGGFTTYQTIEKQSEWIQKEFTEFRVYKEVPSKMWGNVVEVWKFFMRT